MSTARTRGERIEWGKVSREKGDFRWGVTQQAQTQLREITASPQRPSRRTNDGVARGYSFSKGVRYCGTRRPSFAVAAAVAVLWKFFRPLGVESGVEYAPLPGTRALPPTTSSTPQYLGSPKSWSRFTS